MGLDRYARPGKRKPWRPAQKKYGSAERIHQVRRLIEQQVQGAEADKPENAMLVRANHVFNPVVDENRLPESRPLRPAANGRLRVYRNVNRTTAQC
jgi:hypothetical protein